MKRKQALVELATEYSMSVKNAKRIVEYACANGVFTSTDFKVEHVSWDNYKIVPIPQKRANNGED